MRMVEDYYHMIEGISYPSGNDLPSQDRKEMIDFLRNRYEGSQLIAKLYKWVVNYDNLREQAKVLEGDVNLNRQEFYVLLGRPQFS
jgi:hypothetical protein